MKQKLPVTPAIHALRAAKIAFEHHPYRYEEGGGTSVCARELGVDEHCVIKTLVMEDENRKPYIVLMHGDQQVSTKQLARELGVKRIDPCEPKVANRHSGYQVGGTSPFGTRQKMAVAMESTIAELDRVYVNGGSRGYLVSLTPGELQRVLQPKLVTVAR